MTILEIIDKNDFEMLKGNPNQRKDWAKYYKKAG